MSTQQIERLHKVLDGKHNDKYKHYNYTRHARDKKFKLGTTDEEIVEIEQKRLQRYASYQLAKTTTKAKIRRGATRSINIDTFGIYYDDINDQEEYMVAYNEVICGHTDDIFKAWIC